MRIVYVSLHGHNGRPSLTAERADGHIIRLSYHSDHTIQATKGRERIRVPKHVRDLHEALTYCEESNP